MAQSEYAYHGTPHREQVLREGLVATKADGDCAHIWLAMRPEDAVVSGDVVIVDVIGFGPWPVDEDGLDAWQACYHGGDIGPERLRSWSCKEA